MKAFNVYLRNGSSVTIYAKAFHHQGDRYVFDKADAGSVQFFVASEIVGICEAVNANVTDASDSLTATSQLRVPIATAVPAELSSRAASLEDLLEDYERRIITSALERNQNHLSNTADQLKLTRHQLRYRMQKLNLDSASIRDC